MALVSIKNFVAPLQNRTHLGLIVFTVALFAVFRVAGGALNLSVTPPRAAVGSSSAEETMDEEPTTPRRGIASRSMPASMDEISPARELAKLGLDASEPQESSPRRPPVGDDSDLVNRMIEEPRPASRKPTIPNQADLDEVERRLGLR